MNIINISRLIFILNIINITFSLWIDDNGGYRNILIAVDSSIRIDDCHHFTNQIKDLTSEFSRELWLATDRAIHVASIDVLLSDDLSRRCNVTTVGKRQKWTNADIRLLNARSTVRNPDSLSDYRRLIQVKQTQGCGHPGDVITIDSSVLSRLKMEENLHEKEINKTDLKELKENLTDSPVKEIGKILLSSWARYRWGVFGEFAEGGRGHPAGSLAEDIDLDGVSERCDKHKGNCNTTLEELPSTRPSSSSDEGDIMKIVEVSQWKSDSWQELICGKSVFEVARNHPDFKTSLDTTTERTSTTQTSRHGSYFDSLSASPFTPKTPESSPESYKFNRKNVTSTEAVKPVFRNTSRNRKPQMDRVKIRSNFLTSNRSMKKRDTSNSEYQKVDLKHPMLVSSTNNSNNSDFIGILKPVEEKQFQSNAEPHSRSLLKPAFKTREQKRFPDINSSPEKGISLTDSEEDFDNFPAPDINFVSRSREAIVVTLDLSSSAVAQASVEWLRGGLLRWMFGVGDGLEIGILAAYSNTSFPLSFGPLAPGPSTVRQLEEHMTLLPYQHEVDDNVYGGLYCLECVIRETERMLIDSGIPSESSVLVLTVCEPQLTDSQKTVAQNSAIKIHTISLCPNAPLVVESLAEPQGSWALSQSSVESEHGFTSEAQLGQLMTKISEETLLWPQDARLHTILEEKIMLREDDVERDGAYRRVKGSVVVENGEVRRLIILASSSPAKIVELWRGSERIELHRDTTRRFWALLEGQDSRLSYSLKYLSTSLDLPLTVSVGVYERSEEGGVNIRLWTNTRHYQPMDSVSPFLKVWAEVTKNGEVVHDSDVSLSVTYLSGRMPSTYSLMLLDNGSTEPDVYAGDGIYSRYLTWTPGAGRYILTATASSTSNTMSEKVIDGKETLHRTGHFTVTSASISMIVDSTANGDKFPPSRITDLTVTSLGDSLVNITWSAPGGDLDQGSASKYELKMYSEKDALSEENFESSGIDVYCIQGEEQAPTPAPALFGSPQFCITSLPFSNLHWYFALRAVDGANNTGRISNIVSAYVHIPTTTDALNDTKYNDDIQKVMMSTVIPNKKPFNTDEDLSWRAYGAALIGAVGFVMMTIIICACVICCRRARIRALKDPERPIYKIYVNNAYIQEEDGEIKVMSKDKAEKDHTQQWINSLDKYSVADGTKEGSTDAVEIIGDPSQISSKFAKPVRFGVLTNGSIMREAPVSSSASSSSKPSDEANPDDFKYKDLSETISNSTTDGATGSTSSAGTDMSSTAPLTTKEPPKLPPKGMQSKAYNYSVSYPPLGIPTLPGPTIISIHSSGAKNPKEDYHSDEEGGFRPRYVPGPGPRRHLPPEFSSFRYLPPPDIVNGQYSNPPATLSKMSKITSTLSHGTVRSVKKRRHISFV